MKALETPASGPCLPVIEDSCSLILPFQTALYLTLELELFLRSRSREAQGSLSAGASPRGRGDPGAGECVGQGAADKGIEAGAWSEDSEGSVGWTKRAVGEVWFEGLSWWEKRFGVGPCVETAGERARWVLIQRIIPGGGPQGVLKRGLWPPERRKFRTVPLASGDLVVSLEKGGWLGGGVGWHRAGRF